MPPFQQRTGRPAGTRHSGSDCQTRVNPREVQPELYGPPQTSLGQAESQMRGGFATAERGIFQMLLSRRLLQFVIHYPYSTQSVAHRYDFFSLSSKVGGDPLLVATQFHR